MTLDFVKFIALVFFFTCAYGANEDEPCLINGAKGVCTNLIKCLPAIEDLKVNRKNPKICSFKDSEPIICCPEPPPQPPSTSTPQPVATISTDRTCEPIHPNYTTNKTGQKAWDKCIEYQEKYIYPCKRSILSNDGFLRDNNCRHNSNELIVRGPDAFAGEFPHMVLLGFGDDSTTAQWLCSGTLISEKFILTAAHCSYSRPHGPVTFALMRVLDRKKAAEEVPSNLYKIKQIIVHPEFRAPNIHNDIALLETETVVKLDSNTVPACLQVEVDDSSIAFAVGWGNTDLLQSLLLSKYSTEECTSLFSNSHSVNNRFDEFSQICYGHHRQFKDICQSDSGGPLQIKSKSVHCMYTVIGVTTIYKTCNLDMPRLFTKVIPFVPWIESVVWP